MLTDVRMPDLDGLDLQRKLTEAGVTLPVIVMTGHGDVPLAVAALKAGAADFLEKPFDDKRLIAAVRTALSAGREAWLTPPPGPRSPPASPASPRASARC